MKSADLDAARDFEQRVVVKEHLNWIKRMLGAESPGSSEEENAEVLRRMVADGDSLTNHRDVEFNHLFSREEAAVAFLNAAREQGYLRSTHEYWNEYLSWLTAIRIRMIPTLEEITETELDLTEIASRFDGRPDGWGCMEVIKPHSA